MSGLLSLWIALASPIEAMDDFLLTAHMIQHFILMSVAPPLIVLGAPMVPLLRGLPKGVIRFVLRPLFRTGWLRHAGRFATHPVVAWLAMNIAYLGWHVPAAFELTFRSEGIHDFEHLCFLLTSLVFAGHVHYPSYTEAVRITSLTLLQDQIAAGAQMWVLNPLVFLIPAVALTIRMLSPRFLLQPLRTNPSIH